MRFWVDADSCPRNIRDIVCRAGKRLSVGVVFAANRRVAFPKEFDVEMVIVSGEADAADDYIVANAERGDVVITRDIPLAGRLVDKNLAVINDRGNRYTKDNIRERLSMRNFMLDLYKSGLAPEPTAKFGPKDIKLFADAFDRTIAQLLKDEKNRPPHGVSPSGSSSG